MFTIVQTYKLIFKDLIKSHTVSHIPISTTTPFSVCSHGQLKHTGTIWAYFQSCVIQAMSRNGSTIYIHYAIYQYCIQWIIDLLVLSWLCDLQVEFHPHCYHLWRNYYLIYHLLLVETEQQ